MSFRLWTLTTFVFVAALLSSSPTLGQTVEVEPAAPTLEIGDSQQLTAYVVPEEGERRRDTSIVFFSRSRGALPATREGMVTAEEPGTHEVIALRPGTDTQKRVYTRVEVTVTKPAVSSVSFEDVPEEVYVGTRGAVTATATAANGYVRDDVTVALESSDSEVAVIEGGRRLVGLSPGEVTLTARARGQSATRRVVVVENPVASLDLTGGADSARTGDVLDFKATARTEDGEDVSDVPVRFSVRTEASDAIVPGAAAQVDEEGRFVAEEAGRYTVVATSGSHVAEHTVDVRPRDLQGSIEVVGRGRVRDVHTSDLWVWEAADGRDYAITGTWGGNGEAYFWDVTTPDSIIAVDTVTVDARTVNDVKVSEDGDTCVISREGASDRKNGIVILDCSDPTDVSIITEYTKRLTGGVHNLFIYQNHVYALSAGRRYEIINIEDRSTPTRVGEFELETPGHAVHDVWIEDGIAYSSNWDDGVVLVDVGNGVMGGSPANPVEITRYAYPSGWTHAAFPYEDEQTGRSWVIVGDEAFPNGLNVGEKPTIPAGWLHFVDVTDPEHPSQEARYNVPEAGSHNYWVEGDTLYVAYYNGGLRVVDLSGDLKGDLYAQGREIAHFRPFDPKGVAPNAPMTWGPQPYKGHIFFSDWNSGLWAVKLVEEE